MIDPTTTATVGPVAATSVPREPGYRPRPGSLESLRARRSRRRVARALAGGDWRRVLIDWNLTQHRFKKLEKHDGEIETFLVHFNVVKLCAEFIADLTANVAPTFVVDEDNAEQGEAIADIQSRCLFDARFREAVTKTVIESECVLSVNVQSDPSGTGAVICVEDNDVAFPMGDAGADGQSRTLERRWIVERPGVRAKARYLHVERIRIDGDEWVREREAYKTKSDDVLVDYWTLERVPLGVAGAPNASDRVALPVTTQPFVHLVRGLDDGEPKPTISDDAIGLRDAMTAAITRIARAMELHGSPKYRIPAGIVDKKTGQAIIPEAVVDPEKELEAIVTQFDIAALMDTSNMFVGFCCTDMGVSPSLIGLRLSNITQADTAEKIEIEAKPTIASAERGRPYMEDGVARLMTAACELEASLPGRGWRVDRVTARMTIGLPKSEAERERDAMNRADRGYATKRSVIAILHGEENADSILRDIEAEEAKKAAAQQASFFGAAGLSTDAQAPAGIDDGAGDGLDAELETDTGDALEPAAVEAGDFAVTPASEKVADTALNGAQLDALVGIIKEVTTGQLPADAAEQTMLAAFPAIPEERVKAIIDKVRGFTPRKQEDAA